MVGSRYPPPPSLSRPSLGLTCWVCYGNGYALAAGDYLDHVCDTFIGTDDNQVRLANDMPVRATSIFLGHTVSMVGSSLVRGRVVRGWRMLFETAVGSNFRLLPSKHITVCSVLLSSSHRPAGIGDASTRIVVLWRKG